MFNRDYQKIIIIYSKFIAMVSTILSYFFFRVDKVRKEYLQTPKYRSSKLPTVGNFLNFSGNFRPPKSTQTALETYN